MPGIRSYLLGVREDLRPSAMRMVSYLGNRALRLFQVGTTGLTDHSDDEQQPLPLASGQDHPLYLQTHEFQVDLFKSYKGGTFWADIDEVTREKAILKKVRQTLAIDQEHPFRQKPLLPRMDFLRALALAEVDASPPGKLLADLYVVTFLRNLPNDDQLLLPNPNRPVLRQLAALKKQAWFNDALTELEILGRVSDVQLGFIEVLGSPDFSHADDTLKKRAAWHLERLRKNVFEYTEGRFPDTSESALPESKTAMWYEESRGLSILRCLPTADALKMAAEPFSLVDEELDVLFSGLQRTDPKVSTDPMGRLRELASAMRSKVKNRIYSVQVLSLRHGHQTVMSAISNLPPASARTLSEAYNDRTWMGENELLVDSPSGPLRFATMQLNWLIDNPQLPLPATLRTFYKEPPSDPKERIKFYKDVIRNLSPNVIEELVGDEPGNGVLPRPSALFVLYTRAASKEEREELIRKENERRLGTDEKPGGDRYGPAITRNYFRDHRDKTFERIEIYTINDTYPIPPTPKEIAGDMRAGYWTKSEPERAVFLDTAFAGVRHKRFMRELFETWITGKYTHKQIAEKLTSKFSVDEIPAMDYRRGEGPIVKDWVGILMSLPSVRKGLLGQHHHKHSVSVSSAE